MLWPHEAPGVGRPLDLQTMSQLTFEPVDAERFPAPSAAFEVMRRGGASGAVFNAANEVAVEAFVAGRIRFTRIVELAVEAMLAIGHQGLRDVEDLFEADAKARAWVSERL